MRKNVFTIAMIGLALMAKPQEVSAQADPNFYVYLCFGQSNMEGNAKWEKVDEYVDPRFQMLATCDFNSPKRSLGEWYTADCPIVNPEGKLGVTDYFGRTMVAALPADVRIGVVAVAMGGCPIEVFDKEKSAKTVSSHSKDWWAIEANNFYDGNPYQRLVEMGKKAQEAGVIKGILLHQGCSNCGSPEWPNMVKKIYEDILTELNLKAEDVPLFVGELERADMGGGCSSHNNVVAKMPTTVPTSHVVSSEGLPGNGQDPWHFCAAGYRTFGKRYAMETLKVMGREVKKDANYELPDNLQDFFALDELEHVKDINLKVGNSKKITIKGTFADGHSEILTSETVFESSDFEIDGNTVKATEEKTGTVTATYTDFLGEAHSLTIHVNATATAIDAVSSDPASGHDTIYNLQGQRVASPTKGIYIHHGHMFIMK